MIFTTVLICVGTMLLYMLCGFTIVKTKLADSSHAKSFSGLLLYVCCPCLILSSFQNMEYSMENFKLSVGFFFASLGVELLFFLILWLLLRKKYESAKYRVLTCGAMLGNVGFFGLPLINSIFPDNPIVSCYSIMYVTSMNIVVYTIGVFLITNNKKYISLKAAIINPTTIATAISVPLYLLRITLPEQLLSMITLLGKMSTPICMIVLGMRLASMRFKEIVTQPFVYAVGALKLIVYPLFALGIAYLLPFADNTFRVSMFALSAAPTAAVVLSLAELHEVYRKRCADMLLMSNIISIVTLPLMMLIVS